MVLINAFILSLIKKQSKIYYHRLLILFVSFFVSTGIYAQKIIGKWYGKLKIPTTSLRINFTIKKDSTGYKTTMDSPDQGAFDIPTDKTNIKDGKIAVFINAMMLNYKGTIKKDSIIGVFTQNGQSFPLHLSKNKIKENNRKPRSQEPKKPYPYIVENISFINKQADNIKLAGTLTLPKTVKNPPVVILITGSGPQNRDEEMKIFNHRPFLVLSDFLTRKGIAVLRYDDRGVGESQGQFKGATTADFATDVIAAIHYLKNRKDLHFSKIGLIGHSEGGLIAPIVASQNKAVDFLVLLAAPGVDGATVLTSQKEKLQKLSGISNAIIEADKKQTEKIYHIINTVKNIETIKIKLQKLLQNDTNLTDDIKKRMIASYTDPWLVYFIKSNPKKYLKKVTCPILALNGSKDLQVIPDINLNGIKEATKKNKHVTVKEIKGVNHLFQPCITGNIDEYANIDVTFSPQVLQIITDWIAKTSK